MNRGPAPGVYGPEQGAERVDVEREALVAEALHKRMCPRPDRCIYPDGHRSLARAVLAAVEPLIRADERERCAALIDSLMMAERSPVYTPGLSLAAALLREEPRDE